MCMHMHLWLAYTHLWFGRPSRRAFYRRESLQLGIAEGSVRVENIVQAKVHQIFASEHPDHPIRRVSDEHVTEPHCAKEEIRAVQ